MAPHNRKYGERDSHPIPLWNGIFDHYDRIGIGLWAFAWLVDRIPTDGEQDGIGKVLGGKPIKIKEICSSIRGATYESVRRQLDTLERHGYIRRRRTPYGSVIEVMNSRKWGIWRSGENCIPRQSPIKENRVLRQSGRERSALYAAENCTLSQNKENTAIHSNKETQHKAAASQPEGFLEDMPWVKR